MLVKKIFVLLFVLVTVVINLNGAKFTKEASAEPVLVQHGKGKHWCGICGMNLKIFYKTNHIAKVQHLTDKQYCSLRCLVVDMKMYDINLDTVMVVDSKTEKIISAKTAFYVVGSKIKGTMTKVSKLAFASKGDAEKFTNKYKGKIVDFNSVIKLAQDSLKSDNAMITKKKKKKIYPMGKKIFTKMCDSDIDPVNYNSINKLKYAMKNEKLCHPLKKKQLQAAALYLWEVKRFGNLGKIDGKIKVEKNEKCLVCGMFVYKYPKWATQIFYKDLDTQKHYSFDGVKDMMKFYLNPREWGKHKVKSKDDINKILVTDYYSQTAIDAIKAYYVIGSDIYGPMGDELIPFENEEDAKTFYMDHKGTKVLMFKDITLEVVHKFDE